MSQVQKLFFELSNERNLKEQFLRERNDTLEKYKDCQADAISLHKQVEEMQKTLEWYADENNHNVNVTDQWEPVLPIYQDKGNRARACLKGVETE